MGNTGYIDWHRLDRTVPWARHSDDHHSYVYAFWTVDYGRSDRDHGVTVLKQEDRHPDWYLHAESADHVLGAYAPPCTMVSPNFTAVFDNKLSARPLLASMLLGTADAVYHTPNGMWWADEHDLTRRGKRLLRTVDTLYERPAVLVTFVATGQSTAG